MSNAQITLLHTFDQETPSAEILDYNNPTTWFEFVKETLEGYLFLDDHNYNIEFYDSNFQLVKSTSFSSSPIFSNGETIDYIYVHVLGKHIFNTDDKFELYVTTVVTSDVNESVHNYVINEDGDILYDFGECGLMLYTIHKVGNQLRVIGSDSNHPTVIYALGGNYDPSTMVTYTQPENFSNPYPNPSRNTITLPYTLPSGESSQLRVFNMSGQLVETFNIGSNFDKIQINVSNYPKGTYIYTYNGVTKKFVVQ